MPTPATRYLTITSLLSTQLRHLPQWPEVLEEGRKHPAFAGALLSMIWPRGGGIAVNLGALLSVWWQTEPRRAWSVRPDTAATVREVGLAFLPGEPPASWGGNAILIESRDREAAPLVEDVFAIGCYVAATAEGERRYWVVSLDVHGGADVFGLPCDQGALNIKLAERGELLDLPWVEDTGDALTMGLGGSRLTTPAEQLRALKILRFVFAFSYFVDRPPNIPGSEDGVEGPGWSTSQIGVGPLEELPMGQRKKNRPQRSPLWTYRSLKFDEPDEEGGEGETDAGVSATSGSLDTTGLERARTIVRPHWQRVGRGEGQRVILYGAYSAHRWRRVDKLGTKVGV